jgi:hypothetical protein
VFFPDGGDVFLDVSAASGRPLSIRWLDIRRSEWLGDPAPRQPDASGSIRLVTPAEEGYWAVLVKV